MLSPPRRESSNTTCTTRRASGRLSSHGHGPLTVTTIRRCRAGLTNGVVSRRVFSANKVTCLPRNNVPSSTRLRSSVPITTRPSHSLSLSGPSLRTAAGPRRWGGYFTSSAYSRWSTGTTASLSSSTARAHWKKREVCLHPHQSPPRLGPRFALAVSQRCRHLSLPSHSLSIPPQISRRGPSHIRGLPTYPYPMGRPGG